MTPVVPTIATRIRDRARHHPQGVALREKSLGIWQETTWAGYGDLVERAAHGLLALGVRPGDSVAIQSENRPEWLLADAGAVAARAVTTSLGPSSPATDVEHALHGSGARVLVAEDQEQVDKALAGKAELQDLEWIVYIEPRGVREYAEPSLVSWPDLLGRGEERRREHLRLLDELAAEVSEDDLVAASYTPGTGGPPKRAGLTARDVNLALETVTDGGALPPDPGPGDFALCHLPLSQLAGRLSSAWLSAHAGVQLHFGEPSAGLMRTLREVQPSLFLGAARTWEELRASVETSMASASPVKRRIYELAMRNASAIGRELTAAGGAQSPRTRLRYACGYPFMYRPLRDRLGMRKCRWAVSVSPTAPELLDWFLGLGIPVRENHGLTDLGEGRYPDCTELAGEMA
jgi:long-chain acyl-CoA synthetase